jgi:hypothetical protein
MEDRSRMRRAGSLVIPFVLIVVGVLLLLDNLNVVDVDWATVWKLWPLLLIAIGLEIVLGRRVSGGAVLILVIIVIIGGATLWWSQVLGTEDRSVETITWPEDGVERAEVEFDVVVGELLIAGQSDMSDLLAARFDLAPGVEVNDRFRVSGDVARGSITAEKAFLALPQLFGDKSSKWDVQLNTSARWELAASSGIGDVDLDLTHLRVDSLELDSVAGSIEVEMPEQGGVRARIDGGVGDIRVTVPPGAQARVRVNEGIGDVNVSGRFEQRGDYYQTEGFSGAESHIVLEIDYAIGSVTIR